MLKRIVPNKRSVLLSTRGASVYLVILMIFGIVAAGSIAGNRYIQNMAKQSGHIKNSYFVSSAMESIAAYVKDAFDRGKACNVIAGTNTYGGVICPQTSTACDVYAVGGSKFTTFWDSGPAGTQGTPGVPGAHLYCFAQLIPNPCKSTGAMGIQVTDISGNIKTVCLALAPSDATHLDMFVENKVKAPPGSQASVGYGPLFDSQLFSTTAVAGSPPTTISSIYSSLHDKNEILLSHGPNGSATLPATAISTRLATQQDCNVGAAGAPWSTAEQCEQGCTLASPCIKIAICMPTDATCNPASTNQNLATMNMRFLDPGMMPLPGSGSSAPTTTLPTPTTTLPTPTTTLPTPTTTLPTPTTTLPIPTTTLPTPTTTLPAPTTTTSTLSGCIADGKNWETWFSGVADQACNCCSPGSCSGPRVSNYIPVVSGTSQGLATGPAFCGCSDGAQCNSSADCCGSQTCKNFVISGQASTGTCAP